MAQQGVLTGISTIIHLFWAVSIESILYEYSDQSNPKNASDDFLLSLEKILVSVSLAIFLLNKTARFS